MHQPYMVGLCFAIFAPGSFFKECNIVRIVTPHSHLLPALVTCNHQACVQVANILMFLGKNGLKLDISTGTNLKNKR